MYFYYTRHIRKRIRQRELARYQIEEAITNPDETKEGFGERYLARKSFRGKILEVVYKKEAGLIILITAYWDKGK